MPDAEPFEAEGVRGFLHRPVHATGNGAVLTHGAGGNCSAPLLVAAATAFSAAGLCALRCDLPFRQRRRTGPPSPSGAAQDREGLRQAVAALRRIAPDKVILGGQSYGGRQATMLAAEQPTAAESLLLFSYPLHPPGRPDRLRVEHFPRLRVPCVFVHGSRDPFGSLEEIQSAIRAIAAPVRLIAIDNAGHDLKRGHFDLSAVVAACLAALDQVNPGR